MKAFHHSSDALNVDPSKTKFSSSQSVASVQRRQALYCTCLFIIVAIALCFVEVGNPSIVRADAFVVEDIGISEDGLSSDDGDGRWRARLGRLRRFVVRFIRNPEVVAKTALTAATIVTCVSTGVATCIPSVPPVIAADIEFEGEIEGTAGSPSGTDLGLGRGQATADAVVRFTNNSINGASQPVTAIVSEGSSYDFELSANSPRPPIDTGRAFFDMNFGVSGNSPLFSFSQAITEGTLTGTVPERSFVFNIPAGGFIDLQTTIAFGGEAGVIPEPATILLFSTGLGVYAAVRRGRNTLIEPLKKMF